MADPEKFFLVQLPQAEGVAQPACVGAACDQARRSGVVVINWPAERGSAIRRYPEVASLASQLDSLVAESPHKPFMLVKPNEGGRKKVPQMQGPLGGDSVLKWVQVTFKTEDTTTIVDQDGEGDDDSSSEDEEGCDQVNDSAEAELDRHAMCKELDGCMWDDNHCTYKSRGKREKKKAKKSGAGGSSSTEEEGKSKHPECEEISALKKPGDKQKELLCKAAEVCDWLQDDQKCVSKPASQKEYCATFEDKEGTADERRQACKNSFACQVAGKKCVPKPGAVGLEMLLKVLKNKAARTPSGRALPPSPSSGASDNQLRSYINELTSLLELGIDEAQSVISATSECSDANGDKAKCNEMSRTSGLLCRWKKDGRKCLPDELFDCYDVNKEMNMVDRGEKCREYKSACAFRAAADGKGYCEPIRGAEIPTRRWQNAFRQEWEKEPPQLPVLVRQRTCNMTIASTKERAATLAETIQQCPRHKFCKVSVDDKNNVICSLKSGKELRDVFGGRKATPEECAQIGVEFEESDELEGACDTVDGCEFNTKAKVCEGE